VTGHPTEPPDAPPGLRPAAARFRLTVACILRENGVLRLARRLEDEDQRRRAAAGRAPNA